MPFDASAILFEEAGALGRRFVLCRGGGTLSRLSGDEPRPALRPQTLHADLADIERLAARAATPRPS